MHLHDAKWIAAFADPVRAQSAIDRFTNNSYDLVIEGESYRPRLKPRLGATPKNDLRTAEANAPRTPRRKRR